MFADIKVGQVQGASKPYEEEGFPALLQPSPAN
jgi:hypothetical protein